MIMVVCETLVVICTGLNHLYGCHNVTEKLSLTGIVNGQSDIRYLVDFSKDASEKGYVGDYSKRLVSKSDCVELK